MSESFENFPDSIEESSVFNKYFIYNENQNPLLNLSEDIDEVSSYSNQFRDNFYSNSEHNWNKDIYNDLEGDDMSSPFMKQTRPTEIIIEKEISKNKKKEILFTIEKLPKEKKLIKQKRNRSKNNNNNNGEKKHTKYAFDNVASKIRTNLFKSILVVLNKSLEDQDSSRETKVYTSQISGKIETKIRDKSLYKINISKYGKTVKGNKDLLNMPLRQIFYQDCSKKYKNYQSNNKNLLNEISDNSAFNKTNKILDMTVRQCLEHFRGSEKYDVLDGLEKEYQSLIKKFKEDKEETAYIEKFIDDLNNFEQNFQNRRGYKSS